MLFDPIPPLAERMRPKNLDQYIGQGHLIGYNGTIRKAISVGRIPSMILWGPPGVGKTSLALLMANAIKCQFFSLSALHSGVKDLREVIERAKHLPNCIVFIDEIHRYSKSQQDALLAAVEKGWIRLIGATTENPSFEVNSALLSRCQVYVLEPLNDEDLTGLVCRALLEDDQLVKKKIEVLEYDELLRLSGGDARRLLNLLELVIDQSAEDKKGKIKISNKDVEQIAKDSPVQYDKAGDMHYDVISAFIKSIRGSDPNAAVYWLARMIEGGEDPKFIARRLLILASEDVGLANPTALVMANNCFQAVAVIGMPESRIILSQTVIYLATSPKSNSAYVAITQAQALVKQYGDLKIPLAIRGAHTKLSKELGYGANYKYAHDHPGNFADQNFLPEALNGKIIYQPGENSKEQSIKQWLKALWSKRYNY
jgi:putative ATPase